MPGFSSNANGDAILYARNGDFSGASEVAEANGLDANGELWIGATTLNAGGTHVNVGTITSPLGTLTVGYSSPNITLDLAGGSAAIESVAVQTGTSPIVPTAAGLITVNGAVVSAGTNPVRTDGTGANTYALEVQISQALAATDATKIGLSNFYSEELQTDANGFTELSDNVKITAIHGWNGSLLETAAVTVTSDGAAITCSVEKSGGGNLTVDFSTGFYNWVTAPDTVTLTPGTDTVPILNYVYFLESTKTLTISTSNWPATEHAPIASVLCQSAASLQTDGAYKVHVWTDHVVATDKQGHIGDLNFWIRQQPATWLSGVTQTYTITTNGGSADNVVLTTTAGVVLQLHEHTFPAFSGTPDYYVVNDSATPYNKVTDLNTLLTDATGASMSGKYFSLVIWGCVSEDTGDCKLFVNLPLGSYNSASGVLDDVDAFSVYTIPSIFRGTGFLISEWKLRHQAAASGTWTSIDEINLLGLFPSLSAGGTAGSIAFTTDSGVATPSANNVNILGGPGVTTSGSGATITINSVVYTDQTATTLTSDSGTYATAAGAYVLPASPTDGELIEIVCITTGIIVTANTGQEIQMGGDVTSTAGTATNSAKGDALVMRYRSTDTAWYCTSSMGVWNLA